MAQLLEEDQGFGAVSLAEKRLLHAVPRYILFFAVDRRTCDKFICSFVQQINW